jgi:hypothetical protein
MGLLRPPADPAFDPALVQPTVAAEDVRDGPDTFSSADSNELIGFLEQQLGADNVPDATRDMLREPVPSGRTAFTRIVPSKATRVAFVFRKTSETHALVISRTEAGNPIPPLSWVARVLSPAGAAQDDVSGWYRELSRRVATAGRATGLVQYDNGNALAVELTLEPVPDDPADIQLVARTHFLRAGSFSADAWGPVLKGATKTGTTKMNGHDGISVRDVLGGGSHRSGCGPHGVVCYAGPNDPNPGQPTGMCCWQGQICGGGWPVVGCPKGACCWVGSGSRRSR